MRILVIGGAEGVGREVFDYFAPGSRNVSRSTGHDIKDERVRRTIANISLEYNAVLNNAYCGDMSQYYMLRELYEVWKTGLHDGYIFHMGTYATYSANWNPDSNYTDMKMTSDELAKKISKRCENNKLRFRCTNLRPGMLDTPKSRLKPHWEGNGIRGIDVAKIIEFLYNLPKDLCIPQIVMQAKHDPL
jgi:NAD(P)-dependent dehydrogenase (short-subunit alcohol dehydrogenase family)